MKKVLLLSLVFGASCPAMSSAVELLTNGNLDQTYSQLIVDNAPAGPGAEDFFLPKPANWINEGTRAISGAYEDELSSEPWAGPAPTPVTADGTNLPSPDGCNGLDCGVFFKAFSGGTNDGAATGHLYQDVPATPGLTYILTGWAGAEPNLMVGGAEIALEFVDAAGGVIGGSGQVIDLLPTLFVDNGEAFDYKKYTATGVAPASAVSVRARASMIAGQPNPLGGGQAFVVDDFSLVAVPEPSSLALGLLALLGTVGGRRR